MFAYGPVDATAIPIPHHLLPYLNPDWFYLSGTGLPRLSWKRGIVVVVVLMNKSFDSTALLRPIFDQAIVVAEFSL